MFLCPQPKTLELKGGYYYFEVGTEPYIETKITPLLSQKESYRIEINEKGVFIEAKDEKGVHYAKTTLYQLMKNYRGCLPFLYIYDEPEYYYRGFMIDVSRHFFTVDEIKKMIDGASLFKFNKFHFHLSDDQGFRMEIESYPQLTAVGSVRPGSHFGKGEDNDTPYGGYYTKEELREIVEYCESKFIEVIPEFDVPGHTSAVISAYPEISCKGEKIEAQTTNGIFSDVLCVGKEETFKLVYAVLDEICEIFPSKYVHIGGDEVPKENWIDCPHCQSKRESLGLKTMDELQTYVTNEIAYYLKKKGKKAICWNEAIRGGNGDCDNLTVSWWLDKTDASLKWMNCGNPTIIEHFNPYYVDYPHGMHTLEKCFSFDPKKIHGLTEMGANSIIGVESPIWTEYIFDINKMMKMCFPRWLAVAETGWNGSEKGDYAQFLKTTKFFCDVLKEYGIYSAEESEWNILPHKRLSQTLTFAKNNISLNTVKNFFKDTFRKND